MASVDENKQDDVVAIELPAPAGWVKKFTPKKGGTPQRNEIVFTSPTGEEIKNKRQLDLYLKSHPGGPAASEFDWGTGDTPRRSARLSEKSKTTDEPVSRSPKKKRKSSTSKGAQEKSNNADAENKAIDEKDTAAGEEEIKESAEASVEDKKEANDGEAITEEAIPEKPNIEKVENKAENEVVSNEPSAVETQKDSNPENLTNEKVENKTENSVVSNEPSAVETQNNAGTKISNTNVDAKIEESKEASWDKETRDGNVDCAEKAVEDKDESKQKKEPTTGS